MNINNQIIQLLASGYTVKEVAGLLGMKKQTVDKRIRVMRKKYQCKSAIQLVVKWLQLAPDDVLPV